MKIQDIVYVALFAALTAALGVIPRIDLGVVPVPITAQTLGPMLAGSILGARRGATSQILFLLLLAAGLPLLAGGRGGRWRRHRRDFRNETKLKAFLISNLSFVAPILCVRLNESVLRGCCGSDATGFAREGRWRNAVDSVNYRNCELGALNLTSDRMFESCERHRRAGISWHRIVTRGALGLDVSEWIIQRIISY